MSIKFERSVPLEYTDRFIEFSPQEATQAEGLPVVFDDDLRECAVPIAWSLQRRAFGSSRR